MKCKMNLLSTLPNLDVVERELQREAIGAKQRIIEQALRVELCKFRDVPEKTNRPRAAAADSQPLQVSGAGGSVLHW